MAEWLNKSQLTDYEPNSSIEISSEKILINFPPKGNSFNTDLNSVPTTTAASDDTDTLDAGITSPLFTQEREVNLFSDSIHRQAVVFGSSNTQQLASPCVNA